MPEIPANDNRLRANESAKLYEAVQTWRYSVDPRQHGFFLAKRQKLTHEPDHDGPDANDSTHAEVAEAPEQQRSSALQTRQQEELDFIWIIGTLARFEEGFFADVDADDCFVGFADPSTYPQNPGWMLRNLLVLIQRRWRLKRVQILSYRDTQSRRDQANSIIMRLECASDATEVSSHEHLPKVTGWERNEHNKLNSRMVDLAEHMDPSRLADQSVDLNLKLMKWRIAPDLDLDVVKRTRCLLLGAGTLGSYVSRNLLGWGVRHMTFVDNATVSFSNPVRQPLFKFDDCLGGGAQKAVRAAAAVKEIYPGVESEGHVLSVPMAGHAVTDEDKVRREYELLRRLIDEHDAIFLLMDTRESRWLPTVMGKSAGKIVMNAALGFDSYVVMRHGGGNPSVRTAAAAADDASASTTSSSSAAAAATATAATATAATATTTANAAGLPAGTSLGCYFCNDVVAPADVRVPLIHGSRLTHTNYMSTCSPSPTARSTSNARSRVRAWRPSRPPCSSSCSSACCSTRSEPRRPHRRRRRRHRREPQQHERVQQRRVRHLGIRSGRCRTRYAARCTTSATCWCRARRTTAAARAARRSWARTSARGGRL